MYGDDDNNPTPIMKTLPQLFLGRKQNCQTTAGATSRYYATPNQTPWLRP